MSKIKPALVTVQYSIAVDPPKDKKTGLKTAVGVVIDPKGIVIAPYENPKQAVSFEIVLGNGTKIPAKVMLADAKVGVAILKIEGDKPFPAADLADAERSRNRRYRHCVGPGRRFLSLYRFCRNR